MVQKVSSLKGEGLSPSDCDSDPEEREISDDDDRNHKHRRREAESQSTERDQVDQVLNRPNRKRNKPFGNGQTYRENDSQSSETWKRRNVMAPNRDNHSFSSEHGRGRGKEFRAWIPRDPIFSSADFASQMLPPLPVVPNLFAGPQGSSWSAFGMMPGVLNGGLDIHPLGLQGALRPSFNIQQNRGITRQRCRDFEERGFCLRGDMCPMEHGVNRIVVEDVQSLSQFNLPVSLPNEHVPTSSAALPSVSASSKMVNHRNLRSRISKPGIKEGGLSNGVSTISGSADGSDFYDPDEPLLANKGPGTSTTPPQQSNSSVFGERQNKNDTTAVDPQGTGSKLWGVIGSKNKPETKGDFGSNDENIGRNVGLQDSDTSSFKTRDATHPSVRKPTQKGLRTVFVTGIPKKDNTIETLLSHFKKFGEVIDIYIPNTGDRAFVQFSKREEAEGALKAPDAVMGNRFIKLFWANRDRITEEVPCSANNASHPSSAQKGKEPQNAAPKSSFSITSSSPPHADNPKPVEPNLSLASRLQKKPANSALLEEFRKRQESFNKKRDALQWELAKLERKAAGSKGEVASEQVAKRQKVGDIAGSAKTETPNSNDSADIKAEAASEEVVKTQKVNLELAQVEAVEHVNIVYNTVDKSSSKPPANMAFYGSPNLKQSKRRSAPPSAPSVLNRFKLDNRPTAFRISPPLPVGLEKVDVLKEHFSAHGELSSVEMEDLKTSDSAAPKICVPLISFANRRSAERAFVNGKCWQGHTLQLIWVASNNSSNGNNEKPSSVSEVSESGNLETKIRNEAIEEKPSSAL